MCMNVHMCAHARGRKPEVDVESFLCCSFLFFLRKSLTEPEAHQRAPRICSSGLQAGVTDTHCHALLSTGSGDLAQALVLVVQALY